MTKRGKSQADIDEMLIKMGYDTKSSKNTKNVLINKSLEENGELTSVEIETVINGWDALAKDVQEIALHAYPEIAKILLRKKLTKK